TERFKFSGAPGPCQRLFCASLKQQPARKCEVRRGVVRIQLEGQLVFALGIAPLPFYLMQIAHQGMCPGKLWIQFQRLSGRVNYFWPHVTRRSAADARLAESVVRLRQSKISRCKRRVLLDRLLKVSNTFFHCCWAIAFFFGELPLQIALINLRRDLARGYKSGAFCTGNRNLYSSSNSLCHLTLQDEGVPEFAVVGLRPEMLVGRGANQLGVKADPTALAYCRAFNYGIDAQRFSDLRHRRVGLFETHH